MKDRHSFQVDTGALCAVRLTFIDVVENDMTDIRDPFSVDHWVRE